MYLSAQHVRSRTQGDDLQAYLHLHGVPGSEPFPTDPLSVPQGHPGLVVHKKLVLRPGGNAVLAYLDIVAADPLWQAVPASAASSTAWWRERLAPLAELMGDAPLPWVVETGEAHVIFNAGEQVSSTDEYTKLLQTALDLWEEWRVLNNNR